MKTLTTLFVATAMLARAAFAQSDNGASERFRMKTGRYTSAPAQTMTCCNMKSCDMKTSAHQTAMTDAEQRFHQKTGRTLEPVQQQVQIASAMPAPTAALRFQAKTGRSATLVASSNNSDCAMMSCCKHNSQNQQM